MQQVIQPALPGVPFNGTFVVVCVDTAKSPSFENVYVRRVGGTDLNLYMLELYRPSPYAVGDVLNVDGRAWTTKTKLNHRIADMAGLQRDAFTFSLTYIGYTHATAVPAKAPASGPAQAQQAVIFTVSVDQQWSSRPGGVAKVIRISQIMGSGLDAKIVPEIVSGRGKCTRMTVRSLLQGYDPVP